MRKINIGAGPNWYEDGWEVLDNAPGKYNENGNIVENVGIIIYQKIHMI